MAQEIFSWRQLSSAEVGNKNVAEISLNVEKATLSDDTKEAMIEIQQEILRAFNGEEVELLINLDGLEVGAIGEILTTQFIHELATLSHEWTQLIVYGGSKFMRITVYTYGSISSAGDITSRNTRTDALELIRQKNIHKTEK